MKTQNTQADLQTEFPYLLCLDLVFYTIFLFVSGGFLYLNLDIFRENFLFRLGLSGLSVLIFIYLLYRWLQRSYMGIRKFLGKARYGLFIEKDLAWYEGLARERKITKSDVDKAVEKKHGSMTGQRFVDLTLYLKNGEEIFIDGSKIDHTEMLAEAIEKWRKFP